MANIVSNLQQIKERSGLDLDGKMVKMPLGNGRLCPVAEKRLAVLLRWVWEREEAFGVTRYETTDKTS